MKLDVQFCRKCGKTHENGACPRGKGAVAEAPLARTSAPARAQKKITKVSAPIADGSLAGDAVAELARRKALKAAQMRRWRERKRAQ